MHWRDTGETHVQDLPQAMDGLIVIALIDQVGVDAFQGHLS
jgi:hypothetical protein